MIKAHGKVQPVYNLDAEEILERCTYDFQKSPANHLLTISKEASGWS